MTEPVQKSRMIRGVASNEQNITVARPFSRRWQIVSHPDPVESTYATLLGLRTAKDESGRPLGDTLI